MPAAIRDESRLVVASAMWASILPEWLLAEVARERAASRSGRQAGEPQEKAGDAKALAYLMTASLWVPLPPGWLEIYGHLVREVNRRRKRRLPAELAELIPAELSAEKVRELEDLKAEIWKRHGNVAHPPSCTPSP